jgi:ABC-2 type transport system ATP-binding protein
MENDAIEAKDLHKTYRSFWRGREARALEGLSLTVPRGACFGLLGPPGAGKTTFARILLSRIEPDSGTLRIFGGTAEAARIGFLPQYAPDPVKFLEQAARHQPMLLILDEPAITTELLDVVQRLMQSEVTILLNSRRAGNVERLCSEVAILRAGRVIAGGKLEEMRAARGFRVTAEALPERLQEDLVKIGFIVGLNSGSCWIESGDRSQLNPLIDRLRAAGTCIASIENVKPNLESIYAATMTAEKTE